MTETVKRPPTMWETRVRSLGREDPLEKEMEPTPVFLSGKSHGWRGLVGYCPWDRKESDMTEQLHYLSIYTIEGFPGGTSDKVPAGDVSNSGSVPASGRSSGGRHGNKLQYSCLKNPMG